MADPEQASERSIEPSVQVAHKGKLERGWRKRSLIRELAEGELTERVLADRHGVARSSINEFKQRHLEDIAYVRDNIEDEFAGLWVAKKSNRLAEYEADLTYIAERLSDEAESGMEPKELIAAKHRALRAVAEELGQLPNRLSVNAEQRVTVEHRVSGLNVDDLK